MIYIFYIKNFILYFNYNVKRINKYLKVYYSKQISSFRKINKLI